jgi:hypothetical protein
MSICRRKFWSNLGSGVFLGIVLSACGTAPATWEKHTSDRGPDESGLVQSLQRQIRERDRRIEYLEFQLNALKAIDQDLEKRRRSSRPPVTLMPIE